MKTRLLVISLLAALVTAGCGQKESTSTASAPAGSSATPATAPAAPAPTASAATATAGATEIQVSANDQMKFTIGDKSSDPSGSLTIDAKAGSVKVTLTNAGTLPKEAMGHNFVLLKPGSDPLAFSTQAAAAKDTDYIPAALKDQVIAHTKVLGPKQSESIEANLQPGEYPFLCSFPAHAQVGMRGKIVVK